jgi:hypothetical protein
MKNQLRRLLISSKAHEQGKRKELSAWGLELLDLSILLSSALKTLLIVGRSLGRLLSLLSKCNLFSDQTPAPIFLSINFASQIFKYDVYYTTEKWE